MKLRDEKFGQNRLEKKKISYRQLGPLRGSSSDFSAV